MTQTTLPLGNTPVDNRRQEVRQAVDNATDALRADGVQPRNYVEQLCWLFFLKAFEEVENRRAEEAEFEGRTYKRRFFTQRHIIRAMVDVVRPKLGERVYDPCFGTAGFLAEAAKYMRAAKKHLSKDDLEKLANETFFGLELGSLTYLLGTMNMLLHGIEGANLELGNTLEYHRSEQRRIVTRVREALDRVDESRRLREEVLSEAHALRSVILRKAFAGEL